jgi:phosphate transport system substrate-binding protein
VQSHKQRRLAWLSVILAFGVLAAACGDDDDNAASTGNESAGSSSEQCTGDITGSGASYPDAFYQEAITAFADVQPDLTVTYNAIGSGAGKEEFGQGLNDFAGSDSLVKEGDGPTAGSFLYVPTTASAVTVSYNLPGVDELQLSPDTVAGLFDGTITKWNDAALQADNPDADLPDTTVVIAHRSDGSGTTNNFTKYLDAASEKWALGSGDTVNWPANSQAGAQNTGVAQIVESNEGAVGYVDLSDATETGLSTASIKNADGKFVAPTVEGVQAALAGATVAEDLTYNPLNAPGADSYPITAPTYILVHTTYDDAATGDAVTCFVKYLVQDTGKIGEELGFAALPSDLQSKAVAQLDKVTSGP